MTSNHSSVGNGSNSLAPLRKKQKQVARRGATWTEDEVQNLFLIWMQPEIIGLLGEKKGSGDNTLGKVVKELGKLGYMRNIGEVRAKVKNLKGEYRRAKENGNHQGFKYFKNVNRILDPSACLNALYSSDGWLKQATNSSMTHFEIDDASTMDPDITFLPNTFEQDQIMDSQHKDHPFKIEFELMSNLNVDFEPMKGAEFPIEIDDGSFNIPPEFGTEESEEIGCNVLNLDNFVVGSPALEYSDNTNALNNQVDGTPLIVITTTDFNDPATTSKRKCETDTSSDAPQKLKQSSSFIKQKRRKLQSISDKMAETVSKLLTSSTEALLAEMKASEERFIQWEEKRRKEDQKREEEMLQKLIQTFQTPSKSATTSKEAFTETDHSDFNNLKKPNFMDPLCVTFDSLGNKLATLVHTQFKETEDNLLDWENKMQKKELQHTEKLFNLLIAATKNCPTDKNS